MADPKLVDPSKITASGERVNASLDVHPAAPSGPEKVTRERGLAGFRVVAEVLEHRNAELALATGVDDFFRQEGNIIEFRPVSAYGVDRVGTYADAVCPGGRSGHSVFGYQRAEETDCRLNPTRSTTLDLVGRPAARRPPQRLRPCGPVGCRHQSVRRRRNGRGRHGR